MGASDSDPQAAGEPATPAPVAAAVDNDVQQMPWDRESRIPFVDEETLDWYLNHKREPFDPSSVAGDPVPDDDDDDDDPEKILGYAMRRMAFMQAEMLHEALEGAVAGVRQQLCAELYCKAVDDKPVDIGSRLRKAAQERELLRDHMMRNRKLVDAELLRVILATVQQNLREGVQPVDIGSVLFNEAIQESDREEDE